MWVNRLRMMSPILTLSARSRRTKNSVGPGHVLGHAKYGVNSLLYLIAVSQFQTHLTHTDHTHAHRRESTEGRGNDLPLRHRKLTLVISVILSTATHYGSTLVERQWHSDAVS
jgi:hypothetical protein